MHLSVDRLSLRVAKPPKKPREKRAQNLGTINCVVAWYYAAVLSHHSGQGAERLRRPPTASMGDRERSWRSEEGVTNFLGVHTERARNGDVGKNSSSSERGGGAEKNEIAWQRARNDVGNV
ncbi:hypothetical protein THAOC_29404 [Thalassiosira oceanica]|uniref:Uncharacterized protein n=1 Tax=Thalassiosira oceanica TaxID=159749 RepID=K0RCG1_THAOC|nr:hypothetical protein THAOC_29404 [Thalassiosira oceanica]|eukprot:EJK51423.1 hypothetical protein THAOC_29404 [Thalassiosira oceanica]